MQDTRGLEPATGTWLDRRLAGLAPGVPAKWRDLLAFVLVLGLVQAVFWGVYASPLWPRPSQEQPDRIAFVETQLARLPKPTVLAAAQARYAPVELPYTACCEPTYLALKLGFDLASVPEEGLGLAAYQQVDNFIILINGSVVFQRGEMAYPGQAFEGQQPVVDRLPSGLLRVGRNELTFITVRQGMPYTDLVPPVVAPWSQVSRWAEVRLWRFTDYRLLSGWTTFLIGLFAVMIALRSQDRRFMLWLAVLCGGWTVFSAYGLVLDPPFGGLMRLWLFFVVNSLVAVGLAGLIDAWTGRPWRGFQTGLAAAFLVFIAFCGVWLALRPMPEGYDLPALAWSGVSVLLGVAVVARLVWHFATTREPRRLEAALLTICAVCVVLDALGEHFGLNAGGYVVDSAPVLLLALAAAFVQRNFTLFKSAVGLNALLTERLTAREAELATAHARERELVRRQAHDDERRRIMRDMHDGLGSQLMSMLLAARRGASRSEDVAEGLQSVIDEMRLMIDSMDSVGESLASALATFQARVRPRVEAAGFSLEWVTDIHGGLPDYPPRAVLQVFRVLQEAVNNALKHSGGDHIRVSVLSAGEGPLVLSVDDNGSGVRTGAPAGRGLANMSLRARSIGGEVVVDGGEAGGAEPGGAGVGTSVTLTLPRSIETTGE
jgi:signal transduction histidine kinase